MQLMERAREWRDLIVYSGALTLREYELACVLNWMQRLSPMASVILKNQLSRTTWIKRQSDDKILLFSPKTAAWYQERWSPDCFFSNRSEETVAKALLRPANRDSNLTAEMMVFDGRLHSIEFNRPPRSVFGHYKEFRLKSLPESSLSWIREVEILSMEILADPMESKG